MDPMEELAIVRREFKVLVDELHLALYTDPKVRRTLAQLVEDVQAAVANATEEP